MIMMLKVNNINVYYSSIHAIRDISLEVNEGEVVALIGANGAGKSTTLKTISGLLRSKTGSIEFMGEDISKTDAYKLVSKGLAHVPEGRRIFQNATVKENLRLGAFLRKDKENLEADYEHVYSLFPILKERQNQMGGTLSGGEQQMLAIGRALMAKPKILLLDEPSMGLAPLLVKEIFDIIKEINKEGTTVFVVEQNANMALAIADRAYVMETGKIVLEGTGKELAASEEVRKAYLGG